ncbi:MAG: hypothetical protein RI907_2366 [Pseudomonadota bacterium]|jgi:flavin-dependent dehydrogenase
MADDFDVIVVGGSLAGCTAATLMARQGAKVAVLERHERPEAFKQMCTHFIQASALPVLQQLGLDRQLDAVGAVRNGIEIHSPFGWIGDHPGAQPDGRPWHGYNVRRSVLDPMVRDLARATPGVHLMAGHTARRLIEAEGRVTGLVTRSAGVEQTLHARLVVAADGRLSDMADRAEVPTHYALNRRFSIIVAMRNVGLRRGHLSQMWMTGPHVAYVFPNDDGVTLLAWAAPRAELRDLPRASLVPALKAFFAQLADAPDLSRAELVGEPMVIKDYPNQWRAPVHKGMALVGDAAASMDYLWGVGCGWALQSASWLAQAVGRPSSERERLDADLANYRRQHERDIGRHRFFINDFARRLHINPVEQLFLAGAARDPAYAARFNRVASRFDSPWDLMSPALLARALWLRLRHRGQGEGDTRVLPQAAHFPEAAVSRQVA